MDNLEDNQFCHLLAIPSEEKLRRVLKYMLNEDEFLSPYGIRSLSKAHLEHPFEKDVNNDLIIHDGWMDRWFYGWTDGLMDAMIIFY